MRVSAEGLKVRTKFLTPELLKRIEGAGEGTDPFTTGTDDLPKAFRADECRVLSPERTELDVLLFWKDDTRTEQKKIRVQTVRKGEQWLVDEVIR